MAAATRHQKHGLQDYSRIVAAAGKGGELFYSNVLVAIEDASGLAVNAADSAGITIYGVSTSRTFSDDPQRDRNANAVLDLTSESDGAFDGFQGEGTGLLNVATGCYTVVQVSGATTPKTLDTAYVVDNTTVTADPGDVTNNVVAGTFLRPMFDGWLIHIPAP